MAFRVGVNADSNQVRGLVVLGSSARGALGAVLPLLLFIVSLLTLFLAATGPDSASPSLIPWAGAAFTPGVRPDDGMLAFLELAQGSLLAIELDLGPFANVEGVMPVMLASAWASLRRPLGAVLPLLLLVVTLLALLLTATGPDSALAAILVRRAALVVLGDHQQALAGIHTDDLAVELLDVSRTGTLVPLLLGPFLGYQARPGEQKDKPGDHGQRQHPVPHDHFSLGEPEHEPEGKRHLPLH